MPILTSLHSAVLVLLILSAITNFAPVFADVIYVDTTATSGSNDGTSWTNAYIYLQDALMPATPGHQIWVAQGIYKPDRGIDQTMADRTASFTLKSGVAIYGGFPTGGGAFADRDHQIYQSILTGDLNGDDTLTENHQELLDDPNRIDNSYHVITSSYTDSTAIVDGFTIIAGNAYEPTHALELPTYQGGALYNQYGNPTFRNCTFTKNMAGWKEGDSGGYIFGGGGGAVYSNNGSITLINCIFTTNISRTSGGAIDIQITQLNLEHCDFYNNAAFFNGGAIKQQDILSATLNHCVFEQNIADGFCSSGGAIHATRCTSTLYKCSFIENVALCSGGGIYNNTSEIVISKCIFKQNTSGTYGGAMSDENNCQLSLQHCAFTENSASDQGGAIFTCGNSRPTLTNCIFTGNSAGGGSAVCSSGQEYLGQVSHNILNIDNCTFAGNAGTTKTLLCYSYSDCTSIVQFSNCIIANDYNDNTYEIRNTDGSNINITYCNLRGGPDSCIDTYAAIHWEPGNIDTDPCFASPGYWSDPCGTPDDYTDDIWHQGDYHLRSTAGRWQCLDLPTADFDDDGTVRLNDFTNLCNEWLTQNNNLEADLNYDGIVDQLDLCIFACQFLTPGPGNWILDESTSRCIGAGNPGMQLADEPRAVPNIRANIGAYGTTSQASKEPQHWSLLADITNDGIVTLADYGLLLKYFSQSSSELPADLNRDNTVDIIDAVLLCSDWLNETAWQY